MNGKIMAQEFSAKQKYNNLLSQNQKLNKQLKRRPIEGFEKRNQ
jgi:hypothetical protein